jgi:hypothetical protein
MDNYLHRIQKYIDFKGISNRSFEASVGISHGLIAKNIKVGSDLGAGVVEKILNTYKDLNPEWLMTGSGKMIRQGKEYPTLGEKHDQFNEENKIKDYGKKQTQLNFDPEFIKELIVKNVRLNEEIQHYLKEDNKHLQEIINLKNQVSELERKLKAS